MSYIIQHQLFININLNNSYTQHPLCRHVNKWRPNRTLFIFVRYLSFTNEDAYLRPNSSWDARLK